MAKPGQIKNSAMDLRDSLSTLIRSASPQHTLPHAYVKLPLQIKTGLTAINFQKI